MHQFAGGTQFKFIFGKIHECIIGAVFYAELQEYAEPGHADGPRGTVGIYYFGQVDQKAGFFLLRDDFYRTFIKRIIFQCNENFFIFIICCFAQIFRCHYFVFYFAVFIEFFVSVVRGIVFFRGKNNNVEHT